MARGLLLAVEMALAPGEVIRGLREALGLTRIEFARALGWSPATISRWERGKAEPSRLAFKTILAFAEERGVRYRPKGSPAGALVPVSAVPPALPRWESPGSAAGPSAPRLLSVGVERPGWSAEATFKLSSSGGAWPAAPSRSRRALGTAGLVAASVCAALLVVGLPGVRRAAAPPAPTRSRVVAPPERITVAPPPVRQPVVAPLPPPLLPAPSAVPPVPLVRLEGITHIGDTRRATFRADDGASFSVEEGHRVGGTRLTSIEDDRVVLVGDGGTTRTVRIGDETELN